MKTTVQDYSFDQRETIKSFFTNDEWETISCALEDYINYDDPNAHPSELLGGRSVSDRVNSIDSKIESLYQLTKSGTYSL